MSDYEIDERPPVNILSLVLNIFTVVILLGVLCVGAIFLTIFFNPQSNLNPFPPPTPLPTLAPPTATPEAGVTLPPTNTLPPPTETPIPADTSTPAPTEPPTATPTQFVIIDRTPVPVTEELDMSGVSFEIREGSPIALQNFVHLEDGCNWMGVAGHAFGLEGNPIKTGITVQLGGFLAGNTVDLLSVTGFATQYGDGGYEFILADRPIATSNTLYVQLLDQAGLPLSERIFFDTYEDCERNLVLIDFQQFR